MIAIVGVGLLFSWLLPNHYLPWVSWHSESLTFVSVLAVVLWGAARTWTIAPGILIAVPRSSIPLLLLALVTWTQVFLGTLAFFGDALVLTAYFLLCIVCLSFGVAGSKSSENLLWMAVVLLAGALISTAILFLQSLDLYEDTLWINRMTQIRRPGANLGQPNQLATLLLMGITSAVYLFELKKLRGLISGPLVVVLLVGIAATESRTGVLSLAALTIYWLLMRRRLGSVVAVPIATCALAGYLLVLWAWPTVLDAYHMNADSQSAIDTSAGPRWIVWPQLIAALMQRPWFGWGLGQTSLAQNAVAHAYEKGEPFTYAHNIILDLALGVGIPLTLILAGAAILWLWPRVRRINNFSSWYCLAVAIPVAVHSMLEFPFAYAYFLAPVMYALGTFGGLSGLEKTFNVKPVAALGAALAMAALLVWAAVEYLQIEEDFRVVRFESLRLGKTPDSYERPKVILLTQLDALLDGGRIVPMPGMSKHQLELSKKVAMKYPWPATQSRYALALALNGQGEEAIRQLNVMRTLHGDKRYTQIRQYWVSVADEKYPQLKALSIP